MADRKSSLDIEALRVAFDSLVIRDVTLRDIRMELRDDFEPKLTDAASLSIRLGWGAKSSHRKTLKRKETGQVASSFYLVHVGTTIRVIDGSKVPDDAPDTVANEHALAHLEATFAAEYEIVGDPTALTDEAQREFAQKNAPYHVWSYWRELAHNMLGRAGVHGVVIPMFVFKKPGDATAESPTSN